MDIFIRVKAAGSRRAVLEDKPYSLSESITNLRELLSAVVEVEVTNYNHRITQPGVLTSLSQQAVGDQAATGRVKFGGIWGGEKIAKLPQALETALQGFEDGLFRVFVGDTELPQLDSPVVLQPGDVLTFIRFAFLSGRLW